MAWFTELMEKQNQTVMKCTAMMSSHHESDYVATITMRFQALHDYTPTTPAWPEFLILVKPMLEMPIPRSDCCWVPTVRARLPLMMIPMLHTELAYRTRQHPTMSTKRLILRVLGHTCGPGKPQMTGGRRYVPVVCVAWHEPMSFILRSRIPLLPCHTSPFRHRYTIHTRLHITTTVITHSMGFTHSMVLLDLAAVHGNIKIVQN
jgi:hypothetical protein